MPVYTPTRTDEPNVSRPRVLFGGISVYLQQHSALFRKTPRFLDRLWDSPSVIQAFAGRAVSTDARLLGDLTVSMLQRRARRAAQGVREARRLDARGAAARRHQPAELAAHRDGGAAQQALKRPVCCTLQGEELFLNGLIPPYREQALALIRQQVGTSTASSPSANTARHSWRELLGIPSSKMAVVPLGINMDGYTEGAVGRRAGGRPFTVGYFARVAPEKGLHVLADAYVRFRRMIGDAPVGSRRPATWRARRGRISTACASTLEQAGLAASSPIAARSIARASWRFCGLDVLSVPATYDEPKGMFLLEAMASGVPVVQPRRGGVRRIVERTGGGLLVEPDDPAALADGLYALWSDRARHGTSLPIARFTACARTTPSPSRPTPARSMPRSWLTRESRSA